MFRYLRAAIAFLTLACVTTGCDPEKAAESKPVSNVSEAGPNRRFKFKPEYKQALNKDGVLIKKRPTPPAATPRKS